MYDSWDYKDVSPEPISALLSRTLPENPCWIEPGVLPKRGKLFYGGESGIGKSILMLSLIRGLIHAVPKPFGASKLVVPQPARVLFIEQELGPWILQSHCRKIFDGDSEDALERFTYMSQVRKLRLDEPDCVPALTDWVLKVGANILCLDPISKMHSYNENASTEIGRLIERLERVMDNCKSNDLSLIYTHHFGKPARDRRYDYDPYDVNNFRGSTSFRNDADTIVTVLRTAEGMGDSGRWWKLGTGWVKTRAAEPPYPTGQQFMVNRDGDLRVHILEGDVAGRAEPEANKAREKTVALPATLSPHKENLTV